ncbi:MAG: ABC transporter substrate-binding protein [Syntrophobacterales bacterium]|jgi:NitT/TauT family transport system substrate-binding protein|nr:ABC transporter substrate-binding protein [Syntrophobacterales bacterium]
MIIRKCTSFLLLGIFFLIPLLACAAADIRFGTLPVIQCLPVFVAAERGYFKEQGITVELVPFNSSLEKDVAFTSGQISGYFGDIPTCMVLSANKVPIKITAVVHNTTKSQRMFALVLAPKFAGRELKDVVGNGVAVSSNTVLDFLTGKFFSIKGIPINQVKMVEIKNIPIRLQMLMVGQVAVAVLPEPLVALSEMKGGKVLMDDGGKGWSATVLSFHQGFLSQQPDKVRLFLKAVAKASDYINKNPKDVRAVMNRECRIPGQLKSGFPVPEFSKLVLPTSDQVDDVYRWLYQKGTIKVGVVVPYMQVVADGYLP